LRALAGGGFGRAEHDTDLHTDLVDEDHQRIGVLDVGRHLAQGLGHQACLQTHMTVAHVALDFRLGGKRRYRVDDHDIHRARAHDHVADLQRLLARVRLADQQVLDINAEIAGIDRVQRMFRVDEGAGAALALAFGDDLQGKRGLARGLRPVDLDDAPTRQTADAKSDVEPERPSGDGGDGLAALVAQPHHGALAELAFDLGECGVEGFFAIAVFACVDGHDGVLVASWMQRAACGKTAVVDSGVGEAIKAKLYCIFNQYFY